MSQEDAEGLLGSAPVGRLGTSWEDEPYVVPLNFAYERGKIFFHCAKEGTKLDFITYNPRVCLEVDEFIGIKKGETPCSFGAYYRSALAFGEARLIETAEGKTEALKNLLAKYTEEGLEPVFDQENLDNVRVVEILVNRITGKQRLP